MLYLADLLAAGGTLVEPPAARSFADFSYDSRLTAPGELFLALRTDRADGHDFITHALAAGATGVLCAIPPPSAPGVTIIQADDPLAVVQRWAASRLAAVAPLVVGVTGSVGKTTAKRAIAATLAAAGPVFRSRRSFNSLLGLPLALAHLRDEHRLAVLEYGADRRGEIARLAALFPPHAAVVTAIGDAHLAAFGSPQGVAAEKGALVAALPPNGWAILNGDDPLTFALRDRTAARTITFGLGSHCDLRAEAITFSLDQTAWTLCWGNERVRASIPLLGEPAVVAALAAVATALACGVPLAEAARRLVDTPPPDGRLRPLPARGGATVLDDTYSGAPPGFRAALRTLAALPARRRIAVLGDVEEDHLADPGQRRDVLLAELGALATASADIVIWKGDDGEIASRATPTRTTSKAAMSKTASLAEQPSHQPLPNHAITQSRNHAIIQVVHTAADALRALPADLGPGDLVLVKGGAPARMERVVAGLLAQGADPARALVRQERAWRSVRVGVPGRPTWIRIDLDAIGQNVARLCAIAGVPLMAVLKADAYGHGAVRVARAALAAGASWLAVATLGEARTLRDAGIDAPVLVLGYTPPWQAREAVLLGVDATVWEFEAARAFATAGADLGRQARVQIEVDTGLARLGLRPADAVPLLRTLRDQGAPVVVGLYTHLATADSADETFAREQLRRFDAVVREAEAAGLRPPLVHALNSAGLLRFPEAHYDLVRPGIALYGLDPSSETALPPDFRPTLSFHSEVAQVHEVAPGESVSYGRAFIAARLTRIATVPVGYADGLRRAPAWRAVLVHGRRVPVVGRITMDYVMVDVTELEGVRRGDPVVLIGSQGEACISADEVAGWLGTISYEVVSTILPRVPREVDA
jgi:alanine racemase